jgi:amidase
MDRRALLSLFAMAAVRGVPIRGRAARTVDLTSASIADLSGAFAAGALSSERLTALYLARIAAYDKAGPALNAVLRLNPTALEDARALDAERRASGPRSALHGIPVLLKANIDVAGWPATAGFHGLRDSVATQDAEQTRRLKRAGCVILGLTNMSEFASGAALSTLGGQIRNPFAVDRSPAGSSGGSGAAVAAGFASFALGTDTGGSVRGPASANGVTGIRPTFGLTGRGGIIPLALSLDTVGPLATSVADLAVALTVMAGADPRDEAVVARAPVDYVKAMTMTPGALKGARLGLMRDFMGVEAAWDAVIDEAVAALRREGAEVVDVALPPYVLSMMGGVYTTIRDTEFPHQVETYLASLPGTSFPRTHAEIIRMSEAVTARTAEGWVPNPARLAAYRREAATSGLDGQPYRSAVTEGRKIVRDALEWIMVRQRLEAFVGPTIRPARLIAQESQPEARGFRDLAPLVGWPDLSVPAGYTADPPLPIGLSFVGRPFTEARLLSLGLAFEKARPMRRVPPTTPPLPGERFEY